MQRNDETLKIGFELIDNYRANTDDKDNPLSNAARVEKILGKEIMEKVLYEGAQPADADSGISKDKSKDKRKNKEEVINPNKRARENFVKLLNDVLNDHSTDLAKQGQSPADDAVSLAKLLGKDNVKLYIKAIAEERSSREYRNAVFLKSCTHYEGKKWEKQMIMWVGGPSASGKSYGAKAAVQAISDAVMKKARPDNFEGNDVVSIDGGVEREVSQMRQLVLQVAIKKGYPGIKDLHENTKLDVKPLVKKAALAANLSVVIPETFANPLNRSELEKFDKLKNAVQVFSEVTPAAGMDDDFKMTVERMGNERAWKSKYGTDSNKDLKKLEISFNNLKIGVESKKYNKQFFDYGRAGSTKERDEYMRISKDKVYAGIVNDLIYVRNTKYGSEKMNKKNEKDYNNYWSKCVTVEEKDAIKISIRDFQTWQKEKMQNDIDRKNNPSVPPILPVPEWKAEQEKNNKLAKSNVHIDVRGKEFRQGKMLELENAVNNLYEASNLRLSSSGGSESGSGPLKKSIGLRFSSLLRSSRGSQNSSEIEGADQAWQNVFDRFKPIIPEIMNSNESQEQKLKSLEDLRKMLNDAKAYDNGDSKFIKDSITKIEKTIDTNRDRLLGNSSLSSSSESVKEDDSYLEFSSEEYNIPDMPRTAEVIKDEIETQMAIKSHDIQDAKKWWDEIKQLKCSDAEKKAISEVLRRYVGECAKGAKSNEARSLVSNLSAELAVSLTAETNRSKRLGQSSASIQVKLNGGKIPARPTPAPKQETRPRRMAGDKPPQPIQSEPKVAVASKQTSAPKEEQTEAEATRPSFRK